MRWLPHKSLTEQINITTWETQAFDSFLAYGSFESADPIFKKVFLLQGCGIAEDED